MIEKVYKINFTEDRNGNYIDMEVCEQFVFSDEKHYYFKTEKEAQQAIYKRWHQEIEDELLRHEKRINLINAKIEESGKILEQLEKDEKEWE